MQPNRWRFRLPCGCAMRGTTRGASPDRAHPGLHSEPLDAAIGRVPLPYHPSGCHGRRIRWNNTKHKKTQLLPSNYSTFRSLVVCENFNPKMDPLLSSLMRQASCKCETPRLELKSSQTFLAIKRWKGTKIGKVIKQSRNHEAQFISWCLYAPLVVKLLTGIQLWAHIRLMK